MSFALPLAFLILAHPPTGTPKPTAIALEGKVREGRKDITGKARAILLVEDKIYTLHGSNQSLETELLRLSGVRVKVRGVTGDPRIPRGRNVLVEGYEIVDVGKGVVPRVGRLAALTIDGTSRLIFVDESGRADLLPEGWSQKMNRHVGAKLWIVGEGSGDAFTPVRFALLGPGSNTDGQKTGDSR